MPSRSSLLGIAALWLDDGVFLFAFSAGRAPFFLATTRNGWRPHTTGCASRSRQLMATTCSQLPQTWDRRRGILAPRGKTLLRCAVYRRAASVSISPPPVLASTGLAAGRHCQCNWLATMADAASISRFAFFFSPAARHPCIDSVSQQLIKYKSCIIPATHSFAFRPWLPTLDPANGSAGAPMCQLCNQNAAPSQRSWCCGVR